MGDKNKSEERKIIGDFSKIYFNQENEEAIEGTTKLNNFSLIFVDHALEKQYLDYNLRQQKKFITFIVGTLVFMTTWGGIALFVYTSQQSAYITFIIETVLAILFIRSLQKNSMYTFHLLALVNILLTIVECYLYGYQEPIQMKDVVRCESFLFMRLSILISPFFLHNFIVLTIIEAIKCFQYMIAIHMILYIYTCIVLYSKEHFKRNTYLNTKQFQSQFQALNYCEKEQLLICLFDKQKERVELLEMTPSFEKSLKERETTFENFIRYTSIEHRNMDRNNQERTNSKKTTLEKYLTSNKSKTRSIIFDAQYQSQNKEVKWQINDLSVICHEVGELYFVIKLPYEDKILDNFLNQQRCLAEELKKSKKIITNMRLCCEQTDNQLNQMIKQSGKKKNLLRTVESVRYEFMKLYFKNLRVFGMDRFLEKPTKFNFNKMLMKMISIYTFQLEKKNINIMLFLPYKNILLTTFKRKVIQLFFFIFEFAFKFSYKKQNFKISVDLLQYQDTRIVEIKFESKFFQNDYQKQLIKLNQLYYRLGLSNNIQVEQFKKYFYQIVLQQETTQISLELIQYLDELC